MSWQQFKRIDPSYEARSARKKDTRATEAGAVIDIAILGFGTDADPVPIEEVVAMIALVMAAGNVVLPVVEGYRPPSRVYGIKIV
jgi:hypothetical protein